MTTTDEQAAFLRAIAAEPDEDTARLVYADWLDENGQPDRAEFIRVQVELEPLRTVARYDEILQHKVRLERRESALLAAHEAAWRCGPKCATCWPKAGSGKGHYNVSHDCRACDGSGNMGGLMRKLNYTHEGQTRWGVTAYGLDELVRVEFARGFPSRVHCALGEVVEQTRCPACVNGWIRSEGYGPHECPSCRGRDTTEWQPTDWARRVVRAHPVSEFMVTDREPSDGISTGRYTWASDHYSDSSPYILLKFIFDKMKPDRPLWSVGPHTKSYPTPDAARLALARALGVFVRTVGAA